MLKSKLRYLMAEKKINSISELMEFTNVSRDPLNKLYNEKNLETLKLDVLIRICNFFQCSLQDLIEYIPDVK
ncbi:MAG: helix-turn-helix domain-containing protein [Cetobacterium sp.]|uniref:helix-turn-helix domain-containing protein n=1 Tax=Cetobacterium sp. TaxID=2071632 RepID=UPI003EE70C94